MLINSNIIFKCENLNSNPTFHCLALNRVNLSGFKVDMFAEIKLNLEILDFQLNGFGLEYIL